MTWRCGFKTIVYETQFHEISVVCEGNGMKIIGKKGTEREIQSLESRANESICQETKIEY